MFLFIEIGTCRVHLSGITTQPTQRWVAQQARQIVWTLDTAQRRFTHVLRDNDGKYGATFDAVFESEGIEVVRPPFRVLCANAYAERWVRSVCEECLVRVLILDHCHLGYVCASTNSISTQRGPTRASPGKSRVRLLHHRHQAK